MSFTTRCPACGTSFKIVPDQLKISDGWVRCGHCADVFDATLFLQGQAAPVAPVAPPPAIPPSVAVPSPAQRQRRAIPTPVSSTDDGDGDWLVHPPPPSSAPAPPPNQAPTEAARPSVGNDFVDELRRFSRSGGAARPGAVAPPSPPRPEAPAVPAGQVAVAAPVAEAGPDGGSLAGYGLPVTPARPLPPPEHETLLPVEPRFVRQARRKAFWRSRGVRAAMVLLSLLLALGLLAQLAVHERDRLAARFPAATPLLAALCRPTACEIGPVRQIESVVIDSSTLVRRLGNFYAFDFVLKNSARVPVAVPALQLSLTDARDTVIVRRVFLPDELSGAPSLLPAQGSLSLSLRLAIAEQGVSSMSGYRALVFYP